MSAVSRDPPIRAPAEALLRPTVAGPDGDVVLDVPVHVLMPRGCGGSGLRVLEPRQVARGSDGASYLAMEQPTMTTDTAKDEVEPCRLGRRASSSASRKANRIDFHVGMRLRARRLEIGMSQERLAQRLGVAFQQVQKYESGRNRISASRLHQIACALDVPIGYFFEGISSPEDDDHH